MFYVTSIDGSQVEPLINIGNDFNMEQSVDGAFTVSFSTFPENNPGYELLQSESTVTVEGYDFKVKQFRKNDYSKSVTAVSSFFEHAKTYVEDIYGGTRTLEQRLNFVFNYIDWTFTIESSIVDKSVIIANFGESNVIGLINTICTAYGCEYVILPNRTIHFATEIGGDNDYQYRYKHNVGDVVLTEDTTNLTTVVKGYGANDLTVTYRSPNADVFGELEAEPIYDGNYTTVQDLADYLSTQVNDVPELAIESRVVELTLRDIGERVWLIYEPLGVEMQTRIMSQTKVLRNGKLVTDSVIFGNTQPMSSTDLFVKQKAEIDASRKDYRSRFEQTNDRITLEVNQLGVSIAGLEILSDSIALSVVDAKNELQSSITQTAGAIRTEVSGSVTAINGEITTINNNVSSLVQTTTTLQSTLSSQNITIDNLGTRVSSAESSISQQAGEIQFKVSQVDYNGNYITSLINQTAADVSISASKINLNGAVMVNGTLTGSSINGGNITGTTITGGSITSSTNINVDTDLYVGENIYLRSNFGNLGEHSGIYFGTGSWDHYIRNSFTSGLEIGTPNGIGNLIVKANARFTRPAAFEHNASFSSIVNFRNATAMYGVVGSDTDDLFLALNSSNSRLYVRRGGKDSSYDVGFIPLTT